MQRLTNLLKKDKEIKSNMIFSIHKRLHRTPFHFFFLFDIYVYSTIFELFFFFLTFLV